MALLPGEATLLPGRQGAEGRWLARLVPEGGAVEEVRPRDMRAVLRLRPVALMRHGHFQRPCKADRIKDMPAIADAAVRGGVALPARLPEPGSGAGPKAPGVVEVVFAAGPLQAGDLLAI